MKTLTLLATVVLFLVGAASQSISATFEFISGEGKDAVTFIAKTNDREVIKAVRAELAKSLEKRTKHIHGLIERGDEDYNRPWNWHFLRNKWILAEVSMELCDGTPAYVEANLDEWLKKVGIFCPWNSRVSREIEISIQ